MMEKQNDSDTVELPQRAQSGGIFGTDIKSDTVKAILRKQKAYFHSGITRGFDFRKQQLEKLLVMIYKNEERILKALSEDLAKPWVEGFSGEVGFLYEEIKYALKNLKAWMVAEKFSGPLFTFPSSGYVEHHPFGQCLIIAPWNYPVQLLISPLVGCIAAGNTAVLKPSELTPATAKLLEELFEEHFSGDYIKVVNGGMEVSQTLLKERFDFIFFTGSTQVGKVVMRAAAKHLTPICLELGGKSPCVLSKNAKLDVAVRRIVWGKFFNAGQTCVAPDYLYVPKSLESTILEELKKTISRFYGKSPKNSPDLSRIVNQRHFDRLIGLIDSERIYCGGQFDAKERYIAPTVIRNPSWEDPVMQEEIFGPILPVLTYDSEEKLLETLQDKPHPLAFYFFGKEDGFQKKLFSRLQFGGACLNDTLVHLTHHHLPFGGVGDSGMGFYHGRHSFELFSHKRGLHKGSTFVDPSIRYAPYSNSKLKWIKKLFTA